MNQFLIELTIAGIATYACSRLVIPLLINWSPKMGLIDKPNSRKIHAQPIPVVGGLSIALAAVFGILMSETLRMGLIAYPFIALAAILLLITGCLDDRKEIKAAIRLILQISVAVIVAQSGIRIESLHGFLGIDGLSLSLQYILTVFTIVGFVNAFNLMDGIDGLAGFLAIYTLLGISFFALLGGHQKILLLCMVLIIGIISFLQNNLASNAKIFLGDAGTWLIGFILIVLGIRVLQNYPTEIPSAYFIGLVSLYFIPVFDSIRVYIGRIRQGFSPFRADRTHLHHLFLHLGKNQHQSRNIILSITILLSVGMLFLNSMLNMSLALTAGIAFFFAGTAFFKMQVHLVEWKLKLRAIEMGKFAN